MLVFVATHACAQKDPATGMLNQTFRTPYTTQHKMGGVIPVKNNRYAHKTHIIS